MQPFSNFKTPRMKFFLRIIACLALSLSVAGPAQNIYVTQTGIGGDTGYDCPNARALNSLTSQDWVSGTTIHLCGTITVSAGAAGLVVKGSGTSNSPIT